MLAVLAGMAFGLHRKHGLKYLISLSLLSVLIDLDHFLVPMGYATEYRSMHSIWIATLLPAALFFVSRAFENGTDGDGWQTFFLLMTVMLTGHLVMDMTGGPVKLLYPLDNRPTALPYIDIEATDRFISPLANSTGVGIAIYAAIMFTGTLIHYTLWHAKRDKKDTWKR